MNRSRSEIAWAQFLGIVSALAIFNSCATSMSPAKLHNTSNIIIFTDQTTDILTGCLLKSGPNTINSGDKSGIRDKLGDLHGVDSRAIGVIYGSHNELNNHYVQLEEDYEIFVGQDFWRRITGFQNFYDQLIERMTNLPKGLNTDGVFNLGLQALAQQVEHSPLFNF